uniref:DDE Tnp4 domain-containing protein n=1 Tax=Stomoxys calcitrans TaxID=35570 RepID=A0A1I8P617_STOCA
MEKSAKMEKVKAFYLFNSILDELLEISSSEDEDAMFTVLFGRNEKHRVKQFVQTVIHNYSDIEFKTNLRISRDSANDLIQRFSTICGERSYQGGRHQVSAEASILLFLWFSGNKTTLREVSNLFDLSLSTTHSCINKVLDFLVNDVAPQVIKFPSTNEDKEYVAKEFEKISGVPNVLGCIDGSYISIRTPKHKIRSTYANRHEFVFLAVKIALF